MKSVCGSSLTCRSRLSAILLIVVCLFTGGCSSAAKLIPVSGSVTVKGKPAEGAVVLFHPEGNPTGMTASGVAGADGSFALVSATETGVAAGKYKVTIIWPDASKKPTPSQIMMGTAEDGPDLLQGKYASRDKSPLTAEVTATTTKLPPFEL